MNGSVDGPAKPYFEEGDRLYHTRRGQMNVACTQCHENNAGNYIRADLLSEGYSNGFPLYRLAWQRAGSFDYRMEECYGRVRAQPEPYGSGDVQKLPLYVPARATGFAVVTPAGARPNAAPARALTP